MSVKVPAAAGRARAASARCRRLIAERARLEAALARRLARKMIRCKACGFEARDEADGTFAMSRHLREHRGG